MPATDKLTVNLVARHFTAYPVIDTELTALQNSALAAPLSFFTLCIGMAAGFGSTLFSQHLAPSPQGVFVALFSVAVILAAFFGVAAWRARGPGRELLRAIKQRPPVD